MSYAKKRLYGAFFVLAVFYLLHFDLSVLHLEFILIKICNLPQGVIFQYPT